MPTIESVASNHSPRLDIEEAFHSTPDGISLYSCSYPLEAPQGVVLLTHGLGEHSGRYGHVVNQFREKNLAVVRFDLRGHGRSEGPRGHAQSMDELLDDVSLMADFTRNRFPNLPFVVCGHSLGGNIVINWCLRRPEATTIAGAVLSSPWFLLTDRPPAWKVNLIRSASKLWPKLSIPARFRTGKLTRNKEVAAAYEHDPLIHHQITVRLAIEAHEAAVWALKNAHRCQMPVLGVHGAADPITDPEGTRQFCLAAPLADLVVFDDLVHEPYNEPEWKQVVTRVRDWVLDRMTVAHSGAA